MTSMILQLFSFMRNTSEPLGVTTDRHNKHTKRKKDRYEYYIPNNIPKKRRQQSLTDCVWDQYPNKTFRVETAKVNERVTPFGVLRRRTINRITDNGNPRYQTTSVIKTHYRHKTTTIAGDRSRRNSVPTWTYTTRTTHG